MNKIKVISRRNLPGKLPLLQTLVAILSLDYWNAPQWLWGVVGIILTMYWIVDIFFIINSKQVNIFEYRVEDAPDVKHEFQKRKEDMENYQGEIIKHFKENRAKER